MKVYVLQSVEHDKEEDQVWDLAKRYGSTVEEICAANGLEEQEKELSAGRLLLIPRKQ